MIQSRKDHAKARHSFQLNGKTDIGGVLEGIQTNASDRQAKRPVRRAENPDRGPLAIRHAVGNAVVFPDAVGVGHHFSQDHDIAPYFEMLIHPRIVHGVCVGEDHSIIVSHGTDKNDAVVIGPNDNATDRRAHENTQRAEEGKTKDDPKGGFSNGRSQSLSLCRLGSGLGFAHLQPAALSKIPYCDFNSLYHKPVSQRKVGCTTQKSGEACL
jgi:hypothetical protein